MKIEIIKKPRDVRGILRTTTNELNLTDDRITRVLPDRIYLKVKDVKEFEEFSKYGSVELAPIQLQNLLFSQATPNPLENTLETDSLYQSFLENPDQDFDTVEVPLETSTTPLLEAIKEKKLQKSKKSKKELYTPNSKSLETLEAPKSRKPRKSKKSKSKAAKKETLDKI